MASAAHTSHSDSIHSVSNSPTISVVLPTSSLLSYSSGELDCRSNSSSGSGGCAAGALVPSVASAPALHCLSYTERNEAATGKCKASSASPSHLEAGSAASVTCDGGYQLVVFTDGVAASRFLAPYKETIAVNVVTGAVPADYPYVRCVRARNDWSLCCPCRASPRALLRTFSFHFHIPAEKARRHWHPTPWQSCSAARSWASLLCAQSRAAAHLLLLLRLLLLLLRLLILLLRL